MPVQKDETADLLRAIERNTRTTWWELLLGGILRGVGVVMGTALTVALAGWTLTVFGLLPGADEIANYLATIVADIATDGSF